MERVVLIGHEEVRAAGVMMRASAEMMSQTASTLADLLMRHEQFMDEWLERFESALRPPPVTGAESPSITMADLRNLPLTCGCTICFCREPVATPGEACKDCRADRHCGRVR